MSRNVPPDDGMPNLQDVSAVDWIMAFLAFPFLAFAAMFVTSGTVHLLEQRRSRRTLTAICIAAEVLLVGGAVAVVVGGR